MIESNKSIPGKSGRNLIAVALCILAGVVLLSCAGASSDKAAEGGELHYVEGLVREISSEENYLVVKPLKSESIRIALDDRTELVKLSSLEELSRRQQVKVWYESQGEVHRAVRLEKVPDLGC